jgi:hypothetical protein
MTRGCFVMTATLISKAPAAQGRFGTHVGKLSVDSVGIRKCSDRGNDDKASRFDHSKTPSHCIGDDDRRFRLPEVLKGAAHRDRRRGKTKIHPEGENERLQVGRHAPHLSRLSTPTRDPGARLRPQHPRQMPWSFFLRRSSAFFVA